MGEILRAKLAKHAKSIRPKYYFSRYTTFVDTEITTKPLSPIIIDDGSNFLMMGFCVTYIYGIETEDPNTLDNADFGLEISAGRSSFQYQFGQREFMLENHSINSSIDWEHYVYLEAAEQINVAVQNRYIRAAGATMAIGFVAYGEEYRF